MEDLLKKISDVIIKQYSYTKEKNKNFILTEDKKQATCREVVIQKSGKLLAYKFDKEVTIKDIKIEEPFIFLADIKPVRSKCDYIIFYPFETRKGYKMYVLVCNLKSGSLANNDDQMKSGEIFAEFLIKTAIRCFNHDNASNSKSYDYTKDVKIKKILFANLPSTPKGKCKPTNEYLYHKCSETCDFDTICN